MDTLKRAPLVALTAERLRAQLAEGRWPVGTTLPNEVALAGSLGVGRSTLREATRSLAQAGLLESRQGSGTYVLRLEESATLESALDRAALMEIYEVRESLELQAARFAAVRRTEEDLRLMREALAERDRRALVQHEHARAFVEADLAFHRAVAVGAHNELLLAFFDSLIAAAQEPLTALIESRLLAEIDVDSAHGEQLHAIAAGDPEAAMRAVSENIAETLGRIHGPRGAGAAEPAAPAEPR